MAVEQLRREHATILGLARRLGTAWKTLWRAVCPVLERLAADQSRFTGVTSLGADEHIWHHGNPRTRGPKELTGMVDLSRDAEGRVRAAAGTGPETVEEGLRRLPGERGEAFGKGMGVAALDPFGSYKSALDQELGDATAVLDAFHVVKLGIQAMDAVRRRVQQDASTHRGRKVDPLSERPDDPARRSGKPR